MKCDECAILITCRFRSEQLISVHDKVVTEYRNFAISYYRLTWHGITMIRRSSDISSGSVSMSEVDSEVLWVTHTSLCTHIFALHHTHHTWRVVRWCERKKRGRGGKRKGEEETKSNRPFLWLSVYHCSTVWHGTNITTHLDIFELASECTRVGICSDWNCPCC